MIHRLGGRYVKEALSCTGGVSDEDDLHCSGASSKSSPATRCDALVEDFGSVIFELLGKNAPV